MPFDMNSRPISKDDADGWQRPLTDELKEIQNLPLKKEKKGDIGPALAPRFLPEHPIPLLLLIVREFRPQANSADPAASKEY